MEPTSMSTETQTIEALASQEYKAGLSPTSSRIPFRAACPKTWCAPFPPKEEQPGWLLDWRLKAYRHWTTLPEPHWLNAHYPELDYQNIIYYSAPKEKPNWLRWTKRPQTC
jgi:Fe-S cluster assembly protein SufB